MPVYYLGDFATRILVATDTFWLPDGDVRYARTRGGVPVRSQTGARLWTGSMSLIPHYPDQQREVLSIIHALQEVDTFFNVHDPLRAWPMMDPGCVALGSATPTIGSIAADRRSIGMNGLPAGYRLRPGDRFSFSYSASPTRIAYHEIRTSHFAGSGGTAGGIEVTPAIRPGAVAGAAIELLRPACRAMIIPGSVRPPSRGRGIEQGTGFDWVQVLAG